MLKTIDVVVYVGSLTCSSPDHRIKGKEMFSGERREEGSYMVHSSKLRLYGEASSFALDTMHVVGRVAVKSFKVHALLLFLCEFLSIQCPISHFSSSRTAAWNIPPMAFPESYRKFPMTKRNLAPMLARLIDEGT